MPITYHSDYKPFSHEIGKAQLSIDLHEHVARTDIRMEISRLPGREGPLVLNGHRGLELKSVMIDGKTLDPSQYERLPNGGLVLPGIPDACIVEIRSIADISASEDFGLLRAPGDIVYSQGEREGFRRIAFFPDRPDVSAQFDVKLSGNAADFPVLLSNGEKIYERVRKDGRRIVLWRDPVRKPAYLFALAGGRLVKHGATYTTKSGRKVNIGIWKPEDDAEGSPLYAMRQLQSAMRWDEEQNGLEYDLSTLNLVSVPGFGFGGMENKGLIVFRPDRLLVSGRLKPAELAEIRYVVSHEYLHNWTGNRVTVTSWFDTSLKESLTSFRDRKFNAHDRGHVVERIASYRKFARSCNQNNAMEYPIVPESYSDPINVAITSYAYNKGAASILMLETMLGGGVFRPALSGFIRKYDGTHASVEDFMRHMEETSGRDFRQFRTWFTEGNHPKVTLKGTWDAEKHTYTLQVSQKETETPRHFPLVMGLLAPNGHEFPLTLSGEDAAGQGATSRTLEITKAEQTFVFTGITAKPALSPFRSFSAPVDCSLASDAGLSPDDLRLLIAHDSDDFNRWRAAQAYINIMDMPCMKRMKQGLRSAGIQLAPKPPGA